MCLTALAVDSIPEGGTPLIAPAWEFRATGNPPRAVMTTDAGVTRMQVDTAGDEWWDVQLLTRTTAPASKGDVCLAVVELRGSSPLDETGEARVHVLFQKAGRNWDKSLLKPIRVGNQAQTLLLPFVVDAHYQAGEAEFGLGLGDKPQTVELLSARLINYGKSKKLSDLPRTRSPYQGQQPDAPWRAAAAQRIERIRKGDFTVEVVDGDGRPVPDAHIAVNMTRHAFGFGSTVVLKLIGGEGDTNDIYRRHVLDLFNRASAENDLKWPQWEQNDERWSRERTLAGLHWLREHNFVMHGHVLVWPGFRWLPKRLQDIKDDKPALRQAVLDHITDILTATHGLTPEWDVLNEPFANRDLMNALGDEAMVEWFTHAHAIQPQTKLYINDYGILAAGGRTDTAHQRHYEQTIRYLLDHGAPLHAIGMQGHFGEGVTPPPVLWEILDRFAQFGLPIQVTEFDIDTADERLQADYTRDFMTAMFAHEAVEAFVMWGFWEARHWKPNAAMYRRDWSIKPNGEAYKDLVFNQWWTSLKGASDAQGRFTGRGFLGDYIVVAAHGDRHALESLQLTRDGAVVRITLP
jgi:endo-1,4-beta-xylanase